LVVAVSEADANIIALPTAARPTTGADFKTMRGFLLYVAFITKGISPTRFRMALPAHCPMNESRGGHEFWWFR